jgi:hypothetical protein
MTFTWDWQCSIARQKCTQRGKRLQWRNVTDAPSGRLSSITCWGWGQALSMFPGPAEDSALMKWLKSLPKMICFDETRELADHWTKFYDKRCDYGEK